MHFTSLVGNIQYDGLRTEMSSIISNRVKSTPGAGNQQSEGRSMYAERKQWSVAACRMVHIPVDPAGKEVCSGYRSRIWELVPVAQIQTIDHSLQLLWQISFSCHFEEKASSSVKMVEDVMIKVGWSEGEKDVNVLWNARHVLFDTQNRSRAPSVGLLPRARGMCRQPPHHCQITKMPMPLLSRSERSSPLAGLYRLQMLLALPRKLSLGVKSLPARL